MAESCRGGTASMSVREKGPRSAWSSPTRPFSRPVRRADRAETGGLYVCSLALHCRERLAGGGSGIRTGSPTLVFLLWIRLKAPTRLLCGAQQRISSAPTPEQLIADSRLEHQIRTWVPSWLPAIAAAGSRRPTASRSSTSVHSPTIRLTTLGGQYRRHQHRLERLSALVLNDHAMTS